MKKNITIILKKNVHNLGAIGNIVNVKRGYAANYLIPNQIAIPTTEGIIKHNEMIAHTISQKKEEQIIQAEELTKKIEQINKISIKKNTGKDQLIFGSINEKEIIAIIQKNTGITLEKQQIKVPEIKKIGIYILEIKILNDIRATIKLQIIPQDI